MHCDDEVPQPPSTGAGAVVAGLPSCLPGSDLTPGVAA